MSPYDWREIVSCWLFYVIGMIGIIALGLWLIGCTAIQEEWARMEQAEEQYYAQREAVLYTGASEGDVMGAWGSPQYSSSFGGAISGKTVQYGRCATTPNGYNGVIFMTFLNGMLSSWYVTQC